MLERGGGGRGAEGGTRRRSPVTSGAARAAYHRNDILATIRDGGVTHPAQAIAVRVVEYDVPSPFPLPGIPGSSWIEPRLAMVNAVLAAL